jgi:hypothetical protein
MVSKSKKEEDVVLIHGLVELLQRVETDMTIFFRI